MVQYAVGDNEAILGPILTRFADLLEIAPLSQPGLFRQLDEEYFKRIEAVDYTVKHDDGMAIETLDQAEIVLVGVSRCSKTPVSLYLSFRGFRVANVPIVLDLEPPRQLFEIDERRVVAFTVDPPFLQLIRQERERHLGAGPLGSYTEESEIRREVTHARRLFYKYRWPVINVTAKAIEETASEVMRVVYARTGLKKGSIAAD